MPLVSSDKFLAANAGNNRDAVTLGAGFRVKLTDDLYLGAAYELPLTDRNDGLMDYRITTDLVWTF